MMLSVQSAKHQIFSAKADHWRPPPVILLYNVQPVPMVQVWLQTITPTRAQRKFWWMATKLISSNAANVLKSYGRVNNLLPNKISFDRAIWLKFRPVFHLIANFSKNLPF